MRLIFSPTRSPTSHFSFSFFSLPSIFSIFLISILFINQTNAQFYAQSRHGRAKIRCFQCNMPTSCASGQCWGDICIKSISNGKYVSKGCENHTEISRTYRSQGSQAFDPKRDTSYCKVEKVLGIENEICYCSDSDWCNASTRISSLISLLSFSTVLVFLCF
ncbi:unnamed protein product, partial [Mesorhabditis belari]|uniref:Uncharacterized protein n=1 Tax=Mesorhabditis belari TaxID=2138241 RepID=A0AAF3EZY2_9BILA